MTNGPPPRHDEGLEHDLRTLITHRRTRGLILGTGAAAALADHYPHLHFEVFESLSRATNSGQVLEVSQLALPSAACDAVYAQSLYGSGAAHHARTPLTGDMVFGDGGIHQLGTATGSVREGCAVSPNVAVA